MDMVLDESRQERSSLEVYDLGIGADGWVHILAAADAQNFFAADRESFSDFVLGVDGDDFAVDERQIGCGCSEAGH
jgi:hypothetical protein